MRNLIGTSLATAVLLHASASAGVIVVGPPGSGAAFSDVQPAIDAAQPGDTVLVLAGTYGTASITKPLQLVGAGSDLVTLQGPNTAPVLTVTSIPAGETVVVSGLDAQSLFATFAVPQGMARIANNGGTVALSDVVLDDQTGAKAGGLDVVGSALVLVESCVLVGGDGEGIGNPTPGMSAAASTVWIMNSTVQGGTNSYAPGADAVQCTGSSTLYLGACEVLGGMGAIPFGCGYGGGAGVSMTGGLLKAVGPLGHIGGGDSPTGYSTWICGTGKGGVGIHLAGGAQGIVAASLTVEGGLHDQHLFPGSGAEAILVDSGSSLSSSPFLYPTLSADPRTVIGGDSVTFLLKGNPLALGSLFFGLNVGPPTSFAGVDGAAILPSGARLLVTVPLDAAGQGSFALSVPPSPALIGLVGVFQALETGAPQKALSNPVFVTISG